MSRAALILIVLVAAAALGQPAAGLPSGGEGLRRVAVEAPVAAEWRAHLETHGRILDYGDGAYVMRLSDAAAKHVASHPFVRGVRDVLPSQKLAAIPLAPSRYRVLADPAASTRALGEIVEGAGGELVAASAGARDLVLEVAGDASVVAALAARDDVRWIEPIGVATLDDARASSIVQSGTNSLRPIHDRGVDGSSQIVAYCDTGLNTDAPAATGAGWAVHDLFSDPLVPLVQNVANPAHRKVALYYAPLDAQGLRGDMDDADGHGTHIAGAIAGDAIGSSANDGVAPGARLAVCDAARGRSFQVLSDYAGYWTPAWEAGARVHSNSWGTSASGYSAIARQHDAFAFDRPEFLILRSVGNGGPEGEMRAEAAAKNVLGIGASHNDAGIEHVEPFSARGPTSDGRVKPDLVAPGDCVASADLPGAASYACLSGTSQATAVAAGAATLVRDYYVKGFHPSGAPVEADGFEPTSALVRATLVASARTLNATPSEEGWGQPQLDRVLAFAGEATRLWAFDAPSSLETGAAWSATIELTAASTLRVALAWTDPPAAAGSARALVNDLDVRVVGPDGALHGWPDDVNTNERVEIANAAPGTYTIRVTGANVPMGPQTFGVVAVAVG